MRQRVSAGDAMLAIFGLIMSVSAFLPWAEGFRWSRLGIFYHEGALASLSGLALSAAVVARWNATLDEKSLQIAAAGCITVGAAALAAFWSTEIGRIDPIAYRLLAFWSVMPRVQPAGGFWLACSCELAVAAWLVAVSLHTPWRRSRSAVRPLNWPIVTGSG
jgi:hypothetical protein